MDSFMEVVTAQRQRDTARVRSRIINSIRQDLERESANSIVTDPESEAA